MKNSVSCSLGEFKCADSQSLWKIQQPNIVGNSSDNSYDSGIEFCFALWDCSAITSEMLDYSRERNRVAVKSRLVESLMDDLVELGVSSALEEGVKLDV